MVIFLIRLWYPSGIIENLRRFFYAERNNFRIKEINGREILAVSLGVLYFLNLNYALRGMKYVSCALNYVTGNGGQGCCWVLVD